jgi:regulator of protease activity HflC (stomatin/prohibitin superfamily)
VNSVFLYKRLVVGEHTRVLVTKDGRFDAILGPGKYRYFGFGYEFEHCDIREAAYSGVWATHLLNERPDVAAQFFDRVETSGREVAVVSFDGRPARVVEPGGRALFWKTDAKLTARTIDVRENRLVPPDLLNSLIRLGPVVPVAVALVDEGKTGLLYVDGAFVQTLPPGVHGYFTVLETVRVDVLDLRVQTVEIAGQDILTRDKVGLRVNVFAEYRVADAVKAKRSAADYSGLLYRSLQLGVRQTLAKRTLEEALAERVDIDPSVSAAIREEMAEIGIEVRSIALKFFPAMSARS